MNYTFLSVEKGTPSGNETETRALLHLMCRSIERDEIELFAIDCFNDVTGMDSSCLVLHDSQSKAGSNTNPAKLGEELATLFENYVSDFSQFFSSLTLFIGGVSPSVLKDSSKAEFCFEDMKDRAQESVRAHLIETCKKRHSGLFAGQTNKGTVTAFLNSVRFVIVEKNSANYIRFIAQKSSQLLPNERELNRIFAEIRDKQSSLKNRPGIAGKTINRPDAVMDYGRILKARDIKLLVIERLLNREVFRGDVPKDFNNYLLKTLPPEENEHDIIEDCRLELSEQYLDKNNSDAFWTLFDIVVLLFQNNANADILNIFDKIPPDVLCECSHMNRRTHLFFIAIVKEGLKK